jgi:hypothetical protein
VVKRSGWKFNRNHGANRGKFSKKLRYIGLIFNRPVDKK